MYKFCANIADKLFKIQAYFRLPILIDKTKCMTVYKSFYCQLICYLTIANIFIYTFVFINTAIVTK